MTLLEDILEMVNGGKYLKRSKNVKKNIKINKFIFYVLQVSRNLKLEIN